MQRLFGTNGVRGVVNEGMDAQLALDLGRAVGSFMEGRLAVATDTRTSADMLKSALSAGLMATGIEVVDLGVLPTPALQFFVKRGKANGGAMVTASHNPPEFNGIKCIDSDGTEMPRTKEEQIESIYFERRFTMKDWRRMGGLREVSGADAEYMNAIRGAVEIGSVRRASLHVVLDCANGAGSVVTPALLASMGVRCVSLNCDPQGTFPGHPSEPTPENLRDLISLVKETGADLGIAHDGDADRTIFVDEKGNYVDGDRSLAMVAEQVVMEKGGTVVTPISSSSCVEDVVSRAGGKVFYTKVGAPIVAREMMEIGAVFGGEENGGLIFPEHQYCRDGAMAVAKVLEIVARKGPMSSLLAGIPEYFSDKRKVRCPEGLKEPLLSRIVEMHADHRVDLTDGVKIFFEGGWTLIRPSGTEPLYRIFTEDRSREEAIRRGKRYETLISRMVEEA